MVAEVAEDAADDGAAFGVFGISDFEAVAAAECAAVFAAVVQPDLEIGAADSAGAGRYAFLHRHRDY